MDDLSSYSVIFSFQRNRIAESSHADKSIMDTSTLLRSQGEIELRHAARVVVAVVDGRRWDCRRARRDFWRTSLFASVHLVTSTFASQHRFDSSRFSPHFLLKALTMSILLA